MKKEGQGFLTFAQGREYLDCAYLLALSIKRNCKINKICVIVDEETANYVLPKHLKVFDEYSVIQKLKPFENESWAWKMSPFKETIKLESDMIVPSSIDHWWDGLRLKNICFTHKVRDYKGKISKNRHYRKLWDDNNLPDYYNGVMYFRHCVESKEFFEDAKNIYDNYNIYRDKILLNCRHELPDTDIVFSIASLGNNYHIPSLDYPSFVHMKEKIQGWNVSDWRDAVSYALTEDNIFIVNGYAQTYPFHYYHKDLTKELIPRYEQQQ